MGDIVGLVHLIDGFCDLRKGTGTGIDEKHLSIGRLATLPYNGPRNMTTDVDFLRPIILGTPVPDALGARPNGRLQLELEVKA